MSGSIAAACYTLDILTLQTGSHMPITQTLQNIDIPTVTNVSRPIFLYTNKLTMILEVHLRSPCHSVDRQVYWEAVGFNRESVLESATLGRASH